MSFHQFLFSLLTDELFEESVTFLLEKLGDDQRREATDELDQAEDHEGDCFVGGQVHPDDNPLLCFLSLGAVETLPRSDTFKFPQKTEKEHLNFYLEIKTVKAKTRKEFRSCKL